MERERTAVCGGRHAAHPASPVGLRDRKEPLVELAAEAAAPLRRADADEVDICLLPPGRREEADEKARQLPVALGDERRVSEVHEEEPREHLGHPPPSPPLVENGDHARVIGRVGVSDLDDAQSGSAH